MIDLRSDTFTTPCEGMLKAIQNAETGDDCYSEDPSIKLLEDEVSELFGKESAIFTPTGTMSNQLAVRSHTLPGDEVLTHSRYHVYYYESAPSSSLSGIHFSIVNNSRGLIAPRDIKEIMKSKPRGPLYAKPTLMILENTVCSLGGKVFTPDQINTPARVARSCGMSVHLDGARIMNACAASGARPDEFARHCDSVSVCFSKGLGAPMGSVLAGGKDLITKARRYRKWFGGALHQSGLMAAACLYGLKKVGLSQLALDHFHALKVYNELSSYVHESAMKRPESNMLIVNCLSLGISPSNAVHALSEQEILVLPWDDDSIRMVFHRGVREADVRGLGEKISEVFEDLIRQQRKDTVPALPALAVNLD